MDELGNWMHTIKTFLAIIAGGVSMLMVLGAMTVHLLFKIHRHLTQED